MRDPALANNAGPGKGLASLHVSVHQGLARLALSHPAPPGQTTIHLEWDAAFDRQIVGLYLAHEGGESYAYTQFEAVDARRAFPGFDEPDFKTPFDVTLAKGENKIEISFRSQGKDDAVYARFHDPERKLRYPEPR